MNSFTYNEKEFMLNGKPFKVISGAMHYFRIVPEYWLDRLTKLKACGFNTVETYIPWNLHERAEGKFDFTGILDLERYITLAEGLGLNLIIRPGPYICAEHDFGGLPSWLLNLVVTVAAVLVFNLQHYDPTAISDKVRFNYFKNPMKIRAKLTYEYFVTAS